MEKFKQKVKITKESYSGKQFEEALKNAYQNGIDDLKKALQIELDKASKDYRISEGVFKSIYILNELTN